MYIKERLCKKGFVLIIFQYRLITYSESFLTSCFLLVADADLHGEVDGPELSGDDRSMASDIQDAAEANLDNESMYSDREALNLVSTIFISEYKKIKLNSFEFPHPYASL